MTTGVHILEVTTKKLMQEFIRFPHALYRKDPNYVPLPNILLKDVLDAHKNPFYKNGATACFLAVDEQKKAVGRIAAIYNTIHLNIYNDDTGFFGFFDCIDDEAVSQLLLATAAAWLKAKGLRRMMGPENLTTNDPTGILVKGFDQLPVFLMPYNFPYYEQLLKTNGFVEGLQLFAYKVAPGALPNNIFEKAGSLEKRLEQQHITFRYLDRKHFKEEMLKLQQVYNKSNEGSWGFIPLDEEAFLHMANDLNQLIENESVLFVEKEQTLIGYAVSVPDFNQVFHTIPDGNLFPLGWWKLLTGRKKINRIRIIILGVLPKWRGLGIDWCLYARIAAYAKAKKLEYGEAGYVMENNRAMNKMLQALGSQIVKTYALFEKPI